MNILNGFHNQWFRGKIFKCYKNIKYSILFLGFFLIIRNITCMENFEKNASQGLLLYIWRRSGLLLVLLVLTKSIQTTKDNMITYTWGGWWISNMSLFTENKYSLREKQFLKYVSELNTTLKCFKITLFFIRHFGQELCLKVS